MTERKPKIEAIENAVDSILAVFPLVDRVSLKQYLDYLGLTSPKKNFEDYLGMTYLHTRKAIVERDEGIAYVKRNAGVHYDMSSLNTFSMIVALSEFAGVNEMVYPFPAMRGTFPYDYIYTTPGMIFSFINFDDYGDLKIETHNRAYPNAKYFEEKGIKHMTVITASKGWAKANLEEIPIKGDAMIARIERYPSDVVRNINFVGEE